MRGAVLAHADAVVGENVDHAQLAQRAEANGRLHVIGKHHEGGAERQHAAVRRHAVDRRAHGVLAHAESHVASGVTPLAAHRALRAGAFFLGRLEIAQPFERRFGGRIEIGRAAHQVGDALRQRVQGQPAGHAGGDGLIGRLPFRQIGRPVLGQLAGDHHFEFGRFGGVIACDRPRSGSAIPAALWRPGPTAVRKLCERFGRDEKLVRGRPAQRLLGGQQFVFAQRARRARRSCPASSGCRSRCACAPGSARAGCSACASSMAAAIFGRVVAVRHRARVPAIRVETLRRRLR